MFIRAICGDFWKTFSISHKEKFPQIIQRKRTDLSLYPLTLYSVSALKRGLVMRERCVNRRQYPLL